MAMNERSTTCDLMSFKYGLILLRYTSTNSVLCLSPILSDSI